MSSSRPSEATVRRLTDGLNARRTDQTIGMWAVYKLADGTVDRQVFVDRDSAIWAIRNRPDRWVPFQIDPAGMTDRLSETLLRWHRSLDRQGYRHTPDMPHPEMPERREHV